MLFQLWKDKEASIPRRGFNKRSWRLFIGEVAAIWNRNKHRQKWIFFVTFHHFPPKNAGRKKLVSSVLIIRVSLAPRAGKGTPNHNLISKNSSCVPGVFPRILRQWGVKTQRRERRKQEGSSWSGEGRYTRWENGGKWTSVGWFLCFGPVWNRNNGKNSNWDQLGTILGSVRRLEHSKPLCEVAKGLGTVFCLVVPTGTVSLWHFSLCEPIRVAFPSNKRSCEAPGSSLGPLEGLRRIRSSY